MKISIVTPCFNAEKYIAETMLSVLNQTSILDGRAELEYLICDGGSKDDTVKIAQAFENSNVQIFSEPDRGMYDALAKGLKRATGDIVAYLNAGDLYHKTAFDVVLELFREKAVRWLTGWIVSYNERGYVTGVKLPYRYRREFFSCGFHGTILPFVQQESTFWSASLLRLLDYECLAGLKYAGDFYLWRQFSCDAELKIVQAYLGGFRVHPGQISEDKAAYRAELRALSAPPRPRDRAQAALDRLVWRAPFSVKKRLNPNGLFVFNHERQEWI